MSTKKSAFKNKSARGVWNSVANSDLIPLEKGAWERTVAEKVFFEIEEMKKHIEQYNSYTNINDK